MVLGAYDVESSHFDDLIVFGLPAIAGGITSAQNYIGTAAGHVGGHSYRIYPTGLSDDYGLVFMVLGV